MWHITAGVHSSIPMWLGAAALLKLRPPRFRFALARACLRAGALSASPARDLSRRALADAIGARSGTRASARNSICVWHVGRVCFSFQKLSQATRWPLGRELGRKGSALRVPFASARKCDVTAVGFEPTHPEIVELESTALDHSAKLSC